LDCSRERAGFSDNLIAVVRFLHDSYAAQGIEECRGLRNAPPDRRGRMLDASRQSLANTLEKANELRCRHVFAELRERCAENGSVRARERVLGSGRQRVEHRGLSDGRLTENSFLSNGAFAFERRQVKPDCVVGELQRCGKILDGPRAFA
jgi:hypothetical protein